MNTKLTTPVLIPVVTILLLAVAFVGYQAASAQNTQVTPGGEPPAAPTGLTAEAVDGLVELSWALADDDSITDVHISRTSTDDEDGGHWIHITGSDGGTTSYVDHHLLEAGAEYIYTTDALNEHLAS